MYTLPTAKADQAVVPLQEHSALLLVTGLLHDDLDDQIDTIRGALEIDPLLASWATCFAHEFSGIRLQSLHSAARWIPQSILPLRSTPLSRSELAPAQRVAWQRITVAAVGVARRASTLAQREKHCDPDRVYWFGLILGVHDGLEEYAGLNGHSPLHGFHAAWPKWVRKYRKALNHGDGGIDACLRTALREHALRQSDSKLVGSEEQALWFRPYPEFHLLAPLLLKKLRRLHELEERFDEVIQTEKLASLQQLAYGASHEINNPLANISTRAQTLMYNEQDAERRRKLAAINDQAFRAYEMIADLMLFAKPPSLEVTEVDLIAIINQTRDELSAMAQDRDVQIRIQRSGQPALLHADETQLTVAIEAICKNGLEAMDRGGVLSIQLEFPATDALARVTISDEGHGLTDTAQRHLFDPFFSGREAGRGLGFGLSKAWRIVEQHRGKIEVSSRSPVGSRFIVSLPLDGPCSPHPSLPVARVNE